MKKYLSRIVASTAMAAALMAPSAYSSQAENISPEDAKKMEEALDAASKKMGELTAKFKINLKNVKPDTLVAKVGDKSFTMQDLTPHFQRMLQTSIKAMGPAVMKLLKPEVLFLMAREDMVNQHLLDSEVQKNEARLLKDPEVQEQLESLRKNILKGALVRETIDREVTKKAIRNKYLEFMKEFPADANEAKLRILVVKEKADAEKIRAQAKSGTDFSKLVRDNSIHEMSRKNDGLLGYVSSLMKEHLLEGIDVAFESKNGKPQIAVGDYTQAFETPLGWAVVKIEDRRKLKKPKLSELEEKLRGILKREATDSFKKGLQKNAKNIVRLHPNTGEPMKSFDEEIKTLAASFKDALDDAELDEAVKPEEGE